MPRVEGYAAATPPAGLPALLVSAFAGGPDAYDEEQALRRAQNWPVFRRAPGFSSHVARDGDRLVGVIWGWVTPPGFEVGLFESLYAAIRAELGAAADDLVGRAEVMVLAVHPDHRGRGLGGTLLETFLAARPGWLIAHAERESIGWYTRRGWLRRGAAGAGSPYVVMSRP